MGVKVDRVGVDGQQRKPDVVGLCHRASQAMGVEVADSEVFIIAALPAGADCHDGFFRLLWDWLFQRCSTRGALSSRCGKHPALLRLHQQIKKACLSVGFLLLRLNAAILIRLFAD
jgi:hypothetical protein